MIPKRLAEATDALGAVREKIRELKAQESILRAKLLTSEEGAISGTSFVAEITIDVSQSIDTGLLPDYIRNDPAYYKTSTSRVVEVRRNAIRLAPESDDEGTTIKRLQESLNT